MFTAILVSVLLQAQPPAEPIRIQPVPFPLDPKNVQDGKGNPKPSPAPTPKPHPAPQGNWHQWHGRPIVDFRRAFPGVVVVEEAAIQNQVYAVVNSSGIVVSTYQLTPTVIAAPAIVTSPVVVDQRPWYRRLWRR